jgi:hypothetical protein
MEEQGFVVFHQEMVKLHVDLREKDANAVKVRRDFRDGHRASKHGIKSFAGFKVAGNLAEADED